MPDSRPVILITGAGSGMGLTTSLYLAAHNYRVYGTVLTPAEAEALRGEARQRNLSVCPVPMDVTKADQIEAAVNGVLQEAGHLDGVVHFAGLGLRGFFEDLSMEEIRKVYDVNVFGVMALTQAVLPHMRQRRQGRIIITTSAAGRLGSMTISGYCSTKFALEGLAECLYQEMYPFGVHVSVLEPGLIQTPHFTVNRNRARRAMDPASPYYRWFCQHEHLVDNLLASNKFTTEDIAREVHRILTARRPRLRYVVSAKLKLVLALRAYLPASWFEAIYWGSVRRMVTAPRVQATGLSSTEMQ
jgi:NAD(P)-dependent dehydrogenase (short-subunit alcohol dehydrogenase family)